MEQPGSWPKWGLQAVMVSALSCSASGVEAVKIEEMEKMLKEAHAEKSRLMESRVSWVCMPMLGSYTQEHSHPLFMGTRKLAWRGDPVSRVASHPLSHPQVLRH